MVNLLQLIVFLRCISVLKGFLQEEKLQKVVYYMASEQMETWRDWRWNGKEEVAHCTNSRSDSVSPGERMQAWNPVIHKS